MVVPVEEEVLHARGIGLLRNKAVVYILLKVIEQGIRILRERAEAVFERQIELPVMCDTPARNSS